MMANFFDQFDAPPAANYFDQFDDPKAEPPTVLAASNEGALQGVTLGFGDELMAALMTIPEMAYRNHIKGENIGPGEAYNSALERERGQLRAAEEAHPYATMAGSIAGGVATGGALGKAGLSFGQRAADAGSGLVKTMAGSAADGAILGGVSGFGSGEGVGDRVGDSALGSGAGLAIGGAVPAVIAVTPAVAKSVGAIIGARVAPGVYAEDAIATALQRAGMTPDQVRQALVAAREDGQTVFTVADALGQPGSRLLSSTVRNQTEASKGVTEQLMARQAGQGSRVSNAIDDAFGASATKRQSMDELYRMGDEASGPLYQEALSAAPVTSERLQQFLSDPVVRSGLSKGMRIQRLEALARGEKFDPYDYAITGLDEAGEFIIDRFPNMRTLNVIKKGLDDILEQYRDPVTNRLRLDEEGRAIDMVRRAFLNEMDDLNPVYAEARAAYAGPASIRDDMGRGAVAASRGRAADNIAEFDQLAPANQQGWRVGYADTLNQRVERAAEGANKVRPLTSGKYKEEIDAFAQPEMAPQLQRRLDRERTMFETQQEVLGNSKTAQRLADDADLAKVDPSVVATLLRGKPISAAIEGVTRFITKELGGMQPGVAQRLAAVLAETRPDVVREILEAAASGRAVSNDVREGLRRVLTAAGATQAGQSF
jgi:hypothetical protein